MTTKQYGDVRYSRDCRHCGHHISVVKNWPQGTSPPSGLSVRCCECGATTHCLSEATSQDTSIAPGQDCPAVVTHPDETFPLWESGGGIYD